nr:2-C-methyl-D-erythritol 2,4-cyclodiphosphate synthase [Xanthomonadales bacterium]
ARGWRLGNADLTLIAEAPKLGPHAAAIQANLAADLGVDADRIGVKATTHERLGALGRGEGLAAHAVVLLEWTG